MAITCRFILLVLIVLLVATPFRSSTKETGRCVRSDQDVPAVDFCDIVAHPEDYNNKVVRIQAKYLTTFESDMLYELRCIGKDHYIQPYLDCDSQESCRLLKENLNKDLSGDPFTGSRAELIMIGRIRIIEKSGRSARELKKTKLGFYITKIVHTMQIPSSEPLPWEFEK